MFCQNCGHEVNESDRFCPYCGAAQGNTSYTYFNEKVNQSQKQPPVKEDTGNVGFGVLAFFFPIVGLILFLCWRKEKPKTAKHTGIGALASVLFSLVAGIFIGICLLI